MNKKNMKRIAAYSLIAFSIFLSVNLSHASLEPTKGPYLTDKKSLDPKSTFSWNEKPFAFIQFDVDDLNQCEPLQLKWVWQFEGNPVAVEHKSVFRFTRYDDLNIWNSMDHWNSQKKHGSWSVATSWFNQGKGGGCDVTQFTVTPEPVSSALFLLGGFVLGVRQYQKKKQRV